MFTLYKKDGSEVNFTTEEGMLKTLEAFPDKYSSIKKEIYEPVNTSDEKITEKEIEDLAAINIDDIKESDIEEIVLKGYSREHAIKVLSEI